MDMARKRHRRQPDQAPAWHHIARRDAGTRHSQRNANQLRGRGPRRASRQPQRRRCEPAHPRHLAHHLGDRPERTGCSRRRNHPADRIRAVHRGRDHPHRHHHRPRALFIPRPPHRKRQRRRFVAARWPRNVSSRMGDWAVGNSRKRRCIKGRRGFAGNTAFHGCRRCRSHRGIVIVRVRPSGLHPVACGSDRVTIRRTDRGTRPRHHR